MNKKSLVACLAAMSLTACGGGGDDPANAAITPTDLTAAKVVQLDCPDGYTTTSLTGLKANLININANSPNATVVYSIPGNLVASIHKLCFGITAPADLDPSISRLSETYEIFGIAPDGSPFDMSKIAMELSVRYSLDDFPANTTQQQMQDGVELFAQEETGVTPVPRLFNTLLLNENAGVVESQLAGAGKFVAGFRP